MIDLHAHYLYGIDDGAESLKMSLAMLQQAREEGIKKVLATPHVNAHTDAAAVRRIQEHFSELTGRLSEENIEIQCRLAGEVNLIGSETDWLEQAWVLIGGRQKYILVETPFHQLPSDFAEILFRIRLKKIVPLLAHPERNIAFQENPEPLVQWIRQGTLLQMDAGSVLGHFGRRCQRFSERLLKAGAAHVVASDAHQTVARNFSVLKEAHKFITNKFGSDLATALFVNNPDRIWEGEQLPGGIRDESALDYTLSDKLRRIFKAG